MGLLIFSKIGNQIKSRSLVHLHLLYFTICKLKNNFQKF